ASACGTTADRDGSARPTSPATPRPTPHGTTTATRSAPSCSPCGTCLVPPAPRGGPGDRPRRRPRRSRRVARPVHRHQPPRPRARHARPRVGDRAHQRREDPVTSGPYTIAVPTNGPRCMARVTQCTSTPGRTHYHCTGPTCPCVLHVPELPKEGA